jgi:iron complex transport system substrate-binding protein
LGLWLLLVGQAAPAEAPAPATEVAPTPAHTLEHAPAPTSAPAPVQGPQHVMSLSLCTDDLLLELLPPERIASVTYYSKQPGNSLLWPQAAKVAVNAGTVEEVLAQKPDLVLAGIYTTPAARALLKTLNMPLLEVAPAVDFDQVRAVTRQVARALSRESVAETLIAKMDATLLHLQSTRPVQRIRVAGWGEGGSIPGKGTMFDAILRAAGAVNIAAPGAGAFTSFDLEQLIQAHPDVLAYSSSTTDSPGLNTDAARHPLLLKLYAQRMVTYPGALYSCGVLESADAAVALRASLLQAMSRS